MQYGKNRSINKVWLKEFKWFTYSTTEDGLYSKVCVVFSKHFNPNGLVTVPLTILTKTTDKIRAHAKSITHKNASVLVDSVFQVVKSQQKSKRKQMSEALSFQVESNKKKLQSIVRTILCWGKQNTCVYSYKDTENIQFNKYWQF